MIKKGKKLKNKKKKDIEIQGIKLDVVKDIDIEKQIKNMIIKFKENLNKKIKDRMIEMEEDNTDHYMIYNCLGIDDDEGKLIDEYQNKGRFLYNHAGSLLEYATIMCFKYKYNESEAKVKIPNNRSPKPKKVEIDCLVNEKAYEIKWRDATTDGDHITKEHTRVNVIKDAGYKPIRIMFFEPNREQAIDIQGRLRELYAEVGGEYYSGTEAWDYVKKETDVDLKKIFEEFRENEFEKVYA